MVAIAFTIPRQDCQLSSQCCCSCKQKWAFCLDIVGLCTIHYHYEISMPCSLAGLVHDAVRTMFFSILFILIEWKTVRQIWTALSTLLSCCILLRQTYLARWGRRNTRQKMKYPNIFHYPRLWMPRFPTNIEGYQSRPKACMEQLGRSEDSSMPSMEFVKRRDGGHVTIAWLHVITVYSYDMIWPTARRKVTWVSWWMRL